MKYALTTSFMLCSAVVLAGAPKPAERRVPRTVLKTATRKVAMVFDVGGKDDRGFNDAANRGLLRATEELGVQSTVLDPINDSGRLDALRKLAEQKPDLAIAVGFLFSDDVVRVAKEHPQQKFAVVDFVRASKDAVPANVLGLSFKEEQGAYLVGVTAALHTRSGKLGFIGGMDAPIIRRFAMGYEAGARSIKPSVDIQSAYAATTPSGFTNPGKGKALALAMYGKGVDVIFHASGATGLGVFDAAKEKKQWVIGVDRNNWKEAPGLMPATMVKHIDTAVFEAVKSLQDGTFRGGIVAMDVKNGGVGLEFNDSEPGLVSDDMRKKVKEAAEAIAGGALQVKGE